MSRSVLRYAENHTRANDGKLQLLGWGGRRSRTQTVTEPPGQARTLEIIRITSYNVCYTKLLRFRLFTVLAVAGRQCLYENDVATA